MLEWLIFIKINIGRHVYYDAWMTGYIWNFKKWEFCMWTIISKRVYGMTHDEEGDHVMMKKMGGKYVNEICLSKCFKKVIEKEFNYW